MTVPPPSDAYLAAVSALLMAMATNSTLTEAEVDELLDAMADIGAREGLLVWLTEAGLLDSPEMRWR